MTRGLVLELVLRAPGLAQGLSPLSYPPLEWASSGEAYPEAVWSSVWTTTKYPGDRLSHGYLRSVSENKFMFRVQWTTLLTFCILVTSSLHQNLAPHGMDRSPLSHLTARLALNTMTDMELQRYGACVRRDAVDGSLRIQYSFESLGSRSVFQDTLPARASSELSPLIFQQGGFADFDFLARLLYQLSNHMVSLYTDEDIRRFLHTIFARFPESFLETLFQIDLPTIKAAWQELISLTLGIRSLDIYRYLIRVGPSLPSWSEGTLEDQFMAAIEVGAADIAAQILQFSISSQRLVDLYELVRRAVASGPKWTWSFETSLLCVRTFLKYSVGARTTQNWTTSALSFLLEKRRMTLEKNKHNNEHDTGPADLESYIGLVHALLRQGADVDAPDPSVQLEKYSPEVGQKLASWRTLLDISYFIHPQLHDILRKFTKFPRDTTRLVDAIRAATEGKDEFLIYIDSRRFDCPEERVWFLELVIEYFSSRPCPTETSYEVWEAALAAGARPDLLTIRCNDTGSRFPPGDLERWTPVYKLLEAVGRTGAAKTASRAGVDDSLLRLIALFISRGAIPRKATLYLATQLKLLKFFAERGVSISKVGPDGVSIAASRGDYETVDFLYSVGFDITPHEPQLQYLEHLIYGGDFRPPFEPVPTQEMVDYVWSLHATSGLPASSKAHELFYLILGTIGIYPGHEHAHRLERCKHLVSTSGLDLSYQPDAYYHTILEAAASGFRNTSYRDSNIALFNYLLQQGAPTSPDVLATLIESGAPEEVINSMLEAGVDLMSPGSGITPLAASIQRGDMKLVHRLLHRGAKIDMAASSRGETLLHLACHSLGYAPPTQAFEILQFLVNLGIDVNSGENEVPLHIAARLGHLEAVMFLLEKGAKVDKRGRIEVWTDPREYVGTNAIDEAARNGRLDVVQLLLNVGATSVHPGKSGYRGAIRKARIGKYSAVIDLIRSHVEFIWGDQGTAMIYDDDPTCFR